MHPGVAHENSGLNGNGMKNAADARLAGNLERLENQPNDLMQGLSLLGIKRCAWCKRCFRSSDPGAVFGGAGEFVCFECIPV